MKENLLKGVSTVYISLSSHKPSKLIIKKELSIILCMWCICLGVITLLCLFPWQLIAMLIMFSVCIVLLILHIREYLRYKLQGEKR